MTTSDKQDQNNPKKDPVTNKSKEDRLAEALRANLRKRKTQAKTRS